MGEMDKTLSGVDLAYRILKERKSDIYFRDLLTEALAAKMVPSYLMKQAMAELTELKSKAVDLTQLDEIKKQRDELDEKLKLVAFERHPNFKVYDTKIAKVIEESKTLVGKDAQDSLVKTLAMPDGEDVEFEAPRLCGHLYHPADFS